MVITLTIRKYQDADKDAVIALIRELQAHEARYFDRMKPPEDIGEWYVEDLKKACSLHNGVILVAEQGFTVVGYAVVLASVSSEDIVDEVPYTFATVVDLAVTANARRKGIGTRLLRACEQHAKGTGVKWLRLSVLSNNVEAIGAYRSFGFKNMLLTMEKPLK